MTLDFSELVPVNLVHQVGILIGLFVLFVAVLEIVRWGPVLTPIVKARRLGASTWRRIFLATILNDAMYQQIQIGYEKKRWLTHSFVMWGFILLSSSTTLNYIFNPTGKPLPIWHSARITGNVGGFFFILGVGVIVYRFATSSIKRDTGMLGDYVFLVLLGFAGATGFAAEFASELNATSYIYSIYVFHLLCCAALLGSAPFTKFVHAIGRPLLRLSENYLAALANLETDTASMHLVPSPKRKA